MRDSEIQLEPQTPSQSPQVGGHPPPPSSGRRILFSGQINTEASRLGDASPVKGLDYLAKTREAG